MLSKETQTKGDIIVPKANIQFIFTKKDRKNTCIHEAAHAVIHSLGGTEVKFIVVANVKNKANNPRLSEGEGGICFIDETRKTANFFIYANEAGNSYADVEGFNKFLASVDGADRKMFIRDIKAFICGGLAGFAIESLMAGKWANNDGAQSDFDKCEVMCELLPGGRDEFSNLVDQTMNAVQSLKEKIIDLAEHLEKCGEVDFATDELVRKYLPKPFSVKGWLT
jgi:hypothetical protein